MSPEKANQTIEGLRGQVRFHRMMNVMQMAVIFCGLILVAFVVFRDTTRLVPPEIRRPYEIGANYANKDYLIDMANYVLGTVLSVTPESVQHNNKVVLKMAHPDGYAQLKMTLDAAAMRINQEKVTTVWIPRKEEVSEGGQWVRVTGRLKTFVSNVLTSEGEQEYFVQFNVTTSGRLYVTKLEQVLKNRNGTKVDPTRPQPGSQTASQPETAAAAADGEQP